MIYLNNDNINYFNVNGLKEICQYNRDVFYNYNKFARQELIIYMKSRIGINNIIIPPFVYNNKFKAKYKIEI